MQSIWGGRQDPVLLAALGLWVDAQLGHDAAGGVTFAAFAVAGAVVQDTWFA